MLKIGLTGSIGMGKSVTARLFAEQGIPVCDADAIVHELYTGEAIPVLAEAFPSSHVEGRIDRQRLSAHLAGYPQDLARLEALIHPLVRRRQQEFLQKSREENHKTVVLDIPLLLETRAQNEIHDQVDMVIVVTAPEAVQQQRVLAREGMTPEKFARLKARQMPDSEKRTKAHFLIFSHLGMDHARAQVKAILRATRTANGTPRHA